MPTPQNHPEVEPMMNESPCAMEQWAVSHTEDRDEKLNPATKHEPKDRTWILIVMTFIVSIGIILYCLRDDGYEQLTGYFSDALRYFPYAVAFGTPIITASIIVLPLHFIGKAVASMWSKIGIAFILSFALLMASNSNPNIPASALLFGHLFFGGVFFLLLLGKRNISRIIFLAISALFLLQVASNPFLFIH